MNTTPVTYPSPLHIEWPFDAGFEITPSRKWTDKEFEDFCQKNPDLQVELEPDGTLPDAIGPVMFAGRLKDELGQWKQIATEHKIVAE